MGKAILHSSFRMVTRFRGELGCAGDPAHRHDRCEYCGSDGADLDYTTDGRCLLCESCRTAYEKES